MYYFTIALLFCSIFGRSRLSHKISKCKNGTTMPGFKLKEFMGQWYVVMESVPSYLCISHNFTLDSSTKPVTVVDKKLSVPMSDVENSHFTRISKTEEYYTISYPGNPAWLLKNTTWTFDFKNSLIFWTDYKNYAGVYECNTQPMMHGTYRSAVNVLSRNLTIGDASLKELYRKMDELHLRPNKLITVGHSHCDANADTRKEWRSYLKVKTL